MKKEQKMMQNISVKRIFFTFFPMLLLSGCVHPTPPKIPFNSAEVAWAQKPGNATIKGCVSGAEFTKYYSYQVPDGNYDSYPIESSFRETPQKNFTIDLLPESEYMHILAKKMEVYNLRVNDYKNVNDPRWVVPSVLPFIPHFTCPMAGPSLCPSVAHFVFSNLPAGNWYIVAAYNSTPEARGNAINVQKITTVEGKTVSYVSWEGARSIKKCSP
ncbi:MAG: hypothetical protein LKI99_03230 [Acetobacter fabarum]|jgi:hypothetical protein|nr:hypothetical protein [Acetobacter fabarum]MCI1908716.1 hypothetical protein [Acetobacter fabarum]MCI1927561.1 hypothetical protein [Acetobacter fabarum]MCI1947576.1 hypothetical protein [Acetobacter fabarum]MCI1988798.1 hypothetical protein [Acetobacter fabarum]